MIEATTAVECGARDEALGAEVTPSPVPRCRVLIVTARTGGGHDSVAAGLAAALADRHGVEVRVKDPFARPCDSPWLSVGRWYGRVAAGAPALWGLFYHLTNRPGAVRLGIDLAALLWVRRLRALLRAEGPDLVVSVHPLCARLVARVLRDQDNAPPHHCVVTDLVTVHRCWAVPGVETFYVATPEGAQALTEMGVPGARIRVTGLPLRPQFVTAASPGADDARDPRPTILLLGGGDAGRALERAARALLAQRDTLRDLIVVCGTNERLRRRLVRLAGARATVLGWSEDVADLMRACDVVVTKAGSVTLAEAWSQGRPALVYHALPGQEQGNLALLAQECLGARVCSMEALPAAAVRLHRERRAGHERHARWWRSATERVAAHVLIALALRRSPAVTPPAGA